MMYFDVLFPQSRGFLTRYHVFTCVCTCALICFSYGVVSFHGPFRVWAHISQPPIVTPLAPPPHLLI